MTPIEDCPTCGTSLEVPDEQLGTRVECPDCGKTFVAKELPRESRPAERARPRRSSSRECPECGAAVEREDRRCPECDAPLSRRRGVSGDVHSKKVAAGVCGILLGALGIHKFVLGFTTAGVIMLLVTVLTCGIGGSVMGVIGLVEGIIYLTKTEEEFHQSYMIEKKEWF